MPLGSLVSPGGAVLGAQFGMRRDCEAHLGICTWLAWVGRERTQLDGQANNLEVKMSLYDTCGESWRLPRLDPLPLWDPARGAVPIAARKDLPRHLLLGFASLI
jgi:hypothetical protein